MFERVVNDPNARGLKTQDPVSEDESLDQIHRNIEAINETLLKIGELK